MTKVQCHHNAKDSHTLPLQVGGELVCYLGAPFVTCTKCQDVSSDHVEQDCSLDVIYLVQCCY